MNVIRPLVAGTIALRLTSKVYFKAYLLKGFVAKSSTPHLNDVTNAKKSTVRAGAVLT